MSKERRYTVDPNILDSWMIDNAEIIHKMSLASSKELIESKSGNETIKLIEFEWKNDVYAKLYIHRDDLPDALENAEKFFVSADMFEEACEVRDFRPLLSKTSNVE